MFLLLPLFVGCAGNRSLRDGSSHCSGLLSDGIIAFSLESSGDLLFIGSITVEVKIWHDVPLLGAGESATEAENLTGEEPHDKTDGGLVLGVAWDDAVDIVEVSISIAKGNAWDVSISSLVDSLGVSVWIADDDEAWLDELRDGVVSEEAWGEALVDALGAEELAELVNSALAVWLGRNGKNILWFLNSVDHTSCELDLLVGHGKIEDMGTITAAGEDVWLHTEGENVRAIVDFSSKHKLDSSLAVSSRHTERSAAPSQFVKFTTINCKHIIVRLFCKMVLKQR